METLVHITEIREEAPGVKAFFFGSSVPIPYKAGQFLTLIFDHHGREERRSFSISGSPACNDPLQVTIKRVTNGAYSRYLTDRAQVGDTFRSTGAAGLFTLPENVGDYRQLFLFAAGIGITPLLPLLRRRCTHCPACNWCLYTATGIGMKPYFIKSYWPCSSAIPGS